MNLMITTFTAAFVFAEESAETFRAGMADAQFETSRYVLFERLRRPSAQDIKFGFEAPHLEIDDQGYSGYTLVDSVILDHSILRVLFTEKGKRVLQIEAGVFEVQVAPGLDLTQFVGSSLMPRRGGWRLGFSAFVRAMTEYMMKAWQGASRLNLESGVQILRSGSMRPRTIL